MKWGCTCKNIWEKNAFSSSSSIPCRNVILAAWESHSFPTTFLLCPHVASYTSKTWQKLLIAKLCMTWNLCLTADVLKWQLFKGLLYSFSVQAQALGVLNKPHVTKTKYKWTDCSLTFASSLFYPNGIPQFNRRHHCRRCGRLVCGSCSTKKMVVEGCRENPTRVCDQCYSYYNQEWVLCSGTDTDTDHCTLLQVLTFWRVSF